MCQEKARHLAETEKMRNKLEDMEVKLRERDREAARQVENVKTQAVFSVSPSTLKGHS